jgi:hypothetical protein
LIERLNGRKDEREKRKGRCFFLGSAERRPERSEGPREQGPRPELLLRGLQGYGDRSGRKSLERRGEARRGVFRKRRSGESFSKEEFDHFDGEKALKGEAQERWGLKETSEVLRKLKNTVERVARP